VKNFVEQISIKFGGFYLNKNDEFGKKSCAVDKHTKILEKCHITFVVAKKA